MTGIWKSKITMSGCSSLTFSTATLPFSASPHISHPLFCSMQDRRERRTGALSSTIRIEQDKSGLFRPWQAAGRAMPYRSTDGNEEGHLSLRVEAFELNTVNTVR